MGTNRKDCQSCGKPVQKVSGTLCNSCTVSNSRRRTRLRAIKFRGGACVVCGYARSYWALSFHHVDPSTKEFALSSGTTWSWKKFKAEVTKCILVCRNCHGEIHAGLITLSDFDPATGAIHADIAEGTLQEDLAAVDKVLPSSSARKRRGAARLYRRHARVYQKTCARKECAVAFTTKIEKMKFCSSECAHAALRRITWPSAEELQQMVWEQPTRQIAKQLGVSDHAVAKWCRKYGIEKPPRGYWQKQKAKSK